MSTIGLTLNLTEATYLELLLRLELAKFQLTPAKRQEVSELREKLLFLISHAESQ